MHTFTADLNLTSAPLVRSIMGFHIAETAGAAAEVRLRDGGASGDIFVQVNLAADESRHVPFSRPVIFPAGVFVDVVSGSVQGGIVPG